MSVFDTGETGVSLIVGTEILSVKPGPASKPLEEIALELISSIVMSAAAMNTPTDVNAKNARQSIGGFFLSRSLFDRPGMVIPISISTDANSPSNCQYITILKHNKLSPLVGGTAFVRLVCLRILLVYGHQ